MKFDRIFMGQFDNEAYSITAVSSKKMLDNNLLTYSPKANFGVFTDKEYAIECITKNYSDMNEGGWFDYIVLEKILLNSIGFIGKNSLTKPERIWYHYNDDKNEYIECKEPPWAFGIFNWIG